jgi:hypothetical protein
MSYPRWTYFPRNQAAPVWVGALVDRVAQVELQIDTRPLPEAAADRLTSDIVLSHLRPGLESLGYTVESGKKAAQKIHRPVLFGENGISTVKYEVDAFHQEMGIAVEVEAGRGAFSNADYRDIIRMSLMVDSSFMVLLQPLYYRTANTTKSAYTSTKDLLEAIYSSQRLHLPFQGALLVGY